MIVIKSNKIFVHKFGMENLYKATIILHIVYTLTSLIYFINPTIMIYTLCVLGFFETAVLSAYSITLNNFIAEKYPKSMNSFQIVRNFFISKIPYNRQSIHQKSQ